MKGDPLPEKPSEKVLIVYYYGVYLNASGKFCHFVCKSIDSIPSNRGDIVACETLRAPGAIVVQKAQELLQDYQEDPELNSSFNFTNGDIVLHADGHGEHTALILNKRAEVSETLFVTSNPKWHPHPRQITMEENTLLGYPNKKTSYFVKVTRRNHHMVATGKSFPMHRLFDLIKEFGCGHK